MHPHVQCHIAKRKIRCDLIGHPLRWAQPTIRQDKTSNPRKDGLSKHKQLMLHKVMISRLIPQSRVKRTEASGVGESRSSDPPFPINLSEGIHLHSMPVPCGHKWVVLLYSLRWRLLCVVNKTISQSQTLDLVVVVICQRHSPGSGLPS